MSKAEERALEKYPADKSVFDKYEKQRYAYICGYIQAEKDLIGKHEKSWRLDEKLWLGIKDIEEASYQYVYDASNDWVYNVPTWNDVKEAFKAGSEWKESFELTWEDIPKILSISEQLKTSWWFRDNYRKKQIGTQVFWEEVLERFKELKGGEV